MSPCKLRKLIEKKRGGRSIRTIAKEIGWSHSALSKFLRGETWEPGIVTMRRINAWLEDRPMPVEAADAYAEAHRALKVLADVIKREVVKEVG